MLKTIGERIEYLLRRQSENDGLVGRGYTQGDLTDWLTGDQVAPNGRRYKITTSTQAVSRIMTGRNKNIQPEVIGALIEIFSTDADWLLFGESSGTENTNLYITEEAGSVAQIVDGMEKHDRQHILYICQRMAQLASESDILNRELLDTQKQLMRAIDQSIEHVPENQQQIIDRLVALTERNGQRVPA